jgi:hypothetical protein
MKIIIITLLVTMLLAVSVYIKVVSTNLNAIFYMPNSDKPFTGKYVPSYYENGQKKSESNYKNGRLDGLSTNWYENGQKKSEVSFKDGKPSGLLTEWYKNGQKERESDHKDGKLNGLITEWYENGQKKMEWNFKNGKDGKPDEFTTWDKNGQKQIQTP